MTKEQDYCDCFACADCGGGTRCCEDCGYRVQPGDCDILFWCHSCQNACEKKMRWSEHPCIDQCFCGCCNNIEHEDYYCKGCIVGCENGKKATIEIGREWDENA